MTVVGALRSNHAAFRLSRFREIRDGIYGGVAFLSWPVHVTGYSRHVVGTRKNTRRGASERWLDRFPPSGPE